jgi:hypothetical protein
MLTLTRSTSHLLDHCPPSSQFSAPAASSRSLQHLTLPLHVDCSIEYDLGKQPLIPAGSSPLLIVDPSFRDAGDSTNFNKM